MQSLLQYKQAGIAAKAQLDRLPQASDSCSQQQPVNSAVYTQTPNDDEEAFGTVLAGIEIRNHVGQGEKIFVVGWAGSDDDLMPRKWSLVRRVGVTLQISLIGLVLTAASGIDATVLPQAAEDLGVSKVAESLATGT